MMIDNRAVIQRGFEKLDWMMNDAVHAKLDHFCYNLLLDAVIENRRRNPSAHQFTGNLINSIVILLFNRMTGDLSKYFAYDRIKNPIRREMSATTKRKTARQRAIHFRPDWQNTPHSKYTPELTTDESYGPDDARLFASQWTPSTKKMFEICVAYTSEYAEWVEMHRQSTGFYNSKRYASQAMLGFGFLKA